MRINHTARPVPAGYAKMKNTKEVYKKGDKIVITNCTGPDHYTGNIYTVQSVYISNVALFESDWLIEKTNIGHISFKYYTAHLKP